MSLPSGYAQVEYIEGTGSQYINTGFTPKSTTQTIMDCYVAAVNTSDNARIFGARTTKRAVSNAYDLLLTTASQWQAYHGSYYKALAINGLGRLSISRNANTCSITSSSGTVTLTPTASTFTAGYPMFLFTLNNTGTASTPAAMKLYSCQIYDASTLVRNYIPCVSNSGEVGLWDDVNSVFYGDAAGVGFVAGPYLAPSTPENFTATASNGVIALSWSAAAGASGYRLYRDGVLIADTAALSYSDAVEFGPTYSYQLRAYSSGGESAAATVAVPTPPSAPVNFRRIADETNPDHVALAWDAVNGAHTYRVFRNGAMIAETSSLNYTDTTPLVGVTYIYSVTAVSDGGESASTELQVEVRGDYSVILPVIETAFFL